MVLWREGWTVSLRRRTDQEPKNKKYEQQEHQGLPRLLNDRGLPFTYFGGTPFSSSMSCEAGEGPEGKDIGARSRRRLADGLPKADFRQMRRVARVCTVGALLHHITMRVRYLSFVKSVVGGNAHRKAR